MYAVAGRDLLLVRLRHALLGVGTVALTAWIGRRIFDAWTGLVAGLLAGGGAVLAPVILHNSRHAGGVTLTTTQLGQNFYVRINDELLAILQARPSRCVSEWVFPASSGTAPIDGREFDRLVFPPALARTGVRGFRCKDPRHTFATRLRMQSVDPKEHRRVDGAHHDPHARAIRPRCA